ncbi:hypothetical protein KKH05_00060, partial [Patescibacteria group bacterium]|nr:hypothetical protein [Patescibacteria group bacterium]
MRKLFIGTTLFVLSFAPQIVSAAANEDIQIGLADKITNLFNWAVSLAGLLALAIIIYGGVSYAASAGNPSRISEAKKWITSAFLGL